MKYCTLRDMYASSIVMGCMRIFDKPLEQTEKVMVEAQCLTPDMGGTATTSEVGDRVAQLL